MDDEESNKIMDDVRDLLNDKCNGDMIEIVSILAGLLSSGIISLRRRHGKICDPLINIIFEKIKEVYQTESKRTK